MATVDAVAAGDRAGPVLHGGARHAIPVPVTVELVASIEQKLATP